MFRWDHYIFLLRQNITHNPTHTHLCLRMTVVIFSLHASESRAGISNPTSSLFSHRAAMRIRVMIIWWWMRLVGGRQPLRASLHRFHLHASCKHTQQDHLNNDNDPRPLPPLPARPCFTTYTTIKYKCMRTLYCSMCALWYLYVRVPLRLLDDGK